MRMPTTIRDVPVFPARITSHRASDTVKRLIESSDQAAALCTSENNYGREVRHLYCVHRFAGKKALFGPWVYLCPTDLRDRILQVKGVSAVKRFEDDEEWHGAWSQDRIPA